MIPWGEQSASGKVTLTEEEKAPLRNTIRDVIGRSYGFDAICRQVERIVAERLRVVEGERDALISYLEVRLARAESAEAAHAALVAGVEALADEYEAAARAALDGGTSLADREVKFALNAVDDLRALLAGGGA